MRYREGEIPKEQLAVHASDDMLILTAVLGVLIGIVLFILGRMGKQMWMWVWGIGLIICSVYLGISMYFDLTLFGYF
ncbi:hypothetical protein NBRC116583_17270 [Arenicella sp. 4NH20-0111]|uniref:hypothetical protein n=1 Tax=Arenicella sp. 4NH20-0111 TaxID=3127648 RepID=UPI0031043823